MSDQNWFYSRSGQTFGPFSRDQIKDMAISGLLLPTDELWLEGHGKRLVQDYKGLLTPTPPKVPTVTPNPPAVPKHSAETGHTKPQPQPSRPYPAKSAKTNAHNPRFSTFWGALAVSLLFLVLTPISYQVWLYNLDERHYRAARKFDIWMPGMGLHWSTIKDSCEKLLRERLLSPSTARFPDDKEAQRQFEEAQREYGGVIDGELIFWYGWVDAENGFGALIRKPYTCTVSTTTGIVYVNLD